jgi:hypothetical protein
MKRARWRQARLHIVEFRGFERFIQGRPYWEVPVLVQRLCGICPVSHHLAAAKAMDRIVGGENLTPTAEKMRRLMHYGQMLQSHALHFFHLCRARTCCSASTPTRPSATSSASRQAPRARGAGRPDAQVRAGDHPPPPARRSTAPARSPAASTRTCRSPSATRLPQRRRPDARVVAGALARQGLHRRNLEEVKDFGVVRLEPPVARPRTTTARWTSITAICARSTARRRHLRPGGIQENISSTSSRTCGPGRT